MEEQMQLNEHNKKEYPPMHGEHVENTSEIGHFKMLTYEYTDNRLRMRFKLVE